MSSTEAPLQFIEKSPSVTYKFRGNHTWADITIRSWKRGGSVNVLSDFGNYAAAWNATGCDDIREFLCDLDFGYFMTKTDPQFGRETDWEATKNFYKKMILEDRREGSLNEKQARKMFEYLEGIEPNQGFFHELCDDDSLARMASDATYQSITRDKPQCRGFWDIIWKVAVETWKKELAEVKNPVENYPKISKEDAEKLLGEYLRLKHAAAGLWNGPFKKAYQETVEKVRITKEEIINLLIREN